VPLPDEQRRNWRSGDYKKWLTYANQSSAWGAISDWQA
jgi:hypothetical protein